MPQIKNGFYDEKYKKDLGILGSKSGRNLDKVGLTKLTPEFLDNTTSFKEAKLTIVCKKIYFQDYAQNVYRRSHGCNRQKEKSMSKVKWTPEQQDAIQEKGSNLLVAAAAGSGKTAVLVERIINKIIQDKIDIDKLLVVTFIKSQKKPQKMKIYKDK